MVIRLVGILLVLTRILLAAAPRYVGSVIAALGTWTLHLLVSWLCIRGLPRTLVTIWVPMRFLPLLYVL